MRTTAETLVGNAGFVLGRQDVLVYNPSNPYTMQYNFTLQRQLASATALTISYAGQRGVHLARFVDGNQAFPQIQADGRKFFPADSVTRNPNLTGVLTDPAQHPVPVTPEEMADHAEQAWNAGATVVHLHFRNQEPGFGFMPSWDPHVATAISRAIRERCPQLVQNFSTGVIGPDISGPLACLEAGRPEVAALNAGTLNYLKLRANGEWAWPPMVFDNPVEKIQPYIETMHRLGIVPECECFDTGIVRSVAMFHKQGLLRSPVHLSLVMGVASGMPCERRDRSSPMLAAWRFPTGASS